MDERGFRALRVSLLSMLIATALATTLPAHAVSKAEANESAGNFIRLFLKNDDGASRYASGDFERWREVLDLHLPGSGRFSGYAIVAVQGSSKSRRAIVRVERGETSQIFYLDFNGIGMINDLYTVEETLAALMDEMRAVLAKICAIELTEESYPELERLSVEQGRVANRIKTLLWRHEKLLATD